jgi:hypothetical protein
MVHTDNTAVHFIVPRENAEGVTCSPTWERNGRRGGHNHYCLMPGSTFHLPGYGGVELASIQGACGDVPGHVRWYVMRCIVEYGLAQPASTDNTLGDWVEHLGAFKHFGLELP